MKTETQQVGSFTRENLTANVYSTDLPGEFKVIYQDDAGKVLEEVPLTGISSYKQREQEILDRLQELSDSSRATPPPDLGDAGEY
jgi:hypothetical protein